VNRRRMPKLARFGGLACLGSLLLLATAFYLFVIAPAAARRDSLEHQAVALREQLERFERNTPAAEQGPAAQLEVFYTHFPESSAAPEALRKVYAAAARHELNLARGEYRMTRERESRLARYQLTLPVKGSYSGMRGFVAEVLKELPFAALDDINIEREMIAKADVEARIRFTLYLGGS
jgi:hypothetical protein